MNASDYLRVKFQSDRQLALYFQHGTKSFVSAAGDLISDMYSGVERVSWYSSCLIPKYHDVCRELITEEKRLVLSLKNIFKYKNVIAFMLYLYFKKTINNSKDNNELKNGKSRIQNRVTTITSVITKKPVSMATRLALAYSLSESLAASGVVTRIVAEKLSTTVRYTALSLQTMGIDQKAAIAARKLKITDPEYYWILYKFEVEMLYYFIAPLLNKIIEDVKNCTYNNFDELSKALQEMYGV